MNQLEQLEMQSGGVSLKVLPERGALVTSLNIRGTELLFVLEESLHDPTRLIRGGIPVMFPFCGSLAEGIFVPSGKQLPQHGFARNMPWRIMDKRSGSLRLRLDSDEETYEGYPYRFRAEQTLLITSDGLQIELQIQNHDSKPMPVAPGWHPYFSCPAGEVHLVDGDLPGLDKRKFSDPKGFDIGIPAPMTSRATFAIPTLGRVALSFSPEMRHVQFWTMPGRDFICIEPFTGPPNYINTPLTPTVPPGAARTFWFRIELINEEE